MRLRLFLLALFVVAGCSKGTGTEVGVVDIKGEGDAAQGRPDGSLPNFPPLRDAGPDPIDKPVDSGAPPKKDSAVPIDQGVPSVPADFLCTLTDTKECGACMCDTCHAPVETCFNTDPDCPDFIVCLSQNCGPELMAGDTSAAAQCSADVARGNCAQFAGYTSTDLFGVAIGFPPWEQFVADHDTLRHALEAITCIYGTGAPAASDGGVADAAAASPPAEPAADCSAVCATEGFGPLVDLAGGP